MCGCVLVEEYHYSLAKERKAESHSASLLTGNPYSTFQMPFHTFMTMCGSYHSMILNAVHRHGVFNWNCSCV